MLRLSRWWLILLTLVAGGGRVLAASSGENKAFTLATNLFRIGSWELAENDLVEFRQKYPNSEHAPVAVLFEARARFQLRQYPGVIELLSTNQHKAGTLRDHYLYWVGRAHFESATNYPAAAEAFARLISEFPGSSLRLDAGIREATARARLEDWPRVVELLEQTNGAFQTAVQAGPPGELLGSGFMLLAEAHRKQGRFAGMDQALQAAEKQPLGSELAWRVKFIRCLALGDQGQWQEARQSSAALPAPAAADERAEKVAFEAAACEQLQLFDEAISNYQKNLAADVPVEQQRRALLKLTELSLDRNKTAEAVQTLEKFLAQFPRGAVAELATLTLGELQLSRAMAGGRVDTNLVARALNHFNVLLTWFPDSPLAGKALLDKGWCLWLEEKWAAAGEQFRLAVPRLPSAGDQAIARFKWADAQYQLRDLAGAITNYQFVVEGYAGVPEVRTRLIERALYQTVRAALDTSDLASATNALRKILDWYPNGFAGPSGLLLTGQGLSRQNDAAGARRLFAEFTERYPTNSLLPEVRLATARTYEREGNWDAAIAQHDGWLNDYTNHPARVEAEYWRAWDHYSAGRETNALRLFTNFVARFPTNELAARAWWWMGDFYFGLTDLLKAEDSYQHVSKVSPESELAYPAMMRAGRVAMVRGAYRDAIRYFTNLVSDPNCPADLKAQAAISAGDGWRLRSDSGETNRETNLKEAIGWYESRIATNTLPAEAWGLIGDCYLQLAVNDELQYGVASNYYQQVIDLPSASVVERSQAKVRLAIVAEKQALLLQQKGDDLEGEAALLKLALSGYLEVFFDPDLREGGKPEALSWTKRAGLDAGRLAETLQQWQPAINVYCELKDLLPPYRAAAENKIQKALEKCPECTGCNGARAVAAETK